MSNEMEENLSLMDLCKSVQLMTQDIQEKGLNKFEVMLAVLLEKPTYSMVAPVELKDSSIHGKGVFATRDINIGEIVTFYPCDYVLVKIPKSNDHIQLGKGSEFIHTGKLPDNILRYAHTTKHPIPRMTIVGDPLCIDDSNYLGHMCNDGAKSHCKRDQMVYKSISAQKMNAFLGPIDGFVFPIVAMKNIPKGTEILIHYGEDYWEKLY